MNEMCLCCWDKTFEQIEEDLWEALVSMEEAEAEQIPDWSHYWADLCRDLEHASMLLAVLTL